ncbi:MAG: hypothetical protein IJU41_07325, partial [Clostridia bacterium]|nr:hypothetical protein [Clostridia bacterium]
TKEHPFWDALLCFDYGRGSNGSVVNDRLWRSEPTLTEPVEKSMLSRAFFNPIRRIGMASRRSRACNRRKAYGITAQPCM